MFLAVLQRTVIDVEFQAAIPEVPGVPGVSEVIEDLTVTPPIVGVPAIPAIPAIPAVPEVAEVSHEEVAKVFLEPSGKVVAENLSKGADVKYYDIKFTEQRVPLFKPVRMKAGTRAAAPAEEILVIENEDGEEVGRTTVAV